MSLSKYDLGTKDWFDENSPWARQEMMTRMLEAARKDFWDPSDEIKAALAEEYQQSVEKYGPCCCMVCCGNPLLDTYTKDMTKAYSESPQGSEAYSERHDSSSSDGTYPPDWNKSSKDGATNQTKTSSSSTGVGTTGEAAVKPPAETSKPSKPSDASAAAERSKDK